MKQVFSHQALSSMLLWMDNYVLEHGQAFENHSSFFYDTDQKVNNYFVYGAPFRNFVYDSSVSNAEVISGVYLDGSFISRGQSDFEAISFDNGWAYFSAEKAGDDRISGDYSVKEVPIQSTHYAEETLLFETKFELHPTTQQELSNLPEDVLTYPIIFVKQDRTRNEPFAFGGNDETILDFRAIAIMDSLWKLEGVKSLFRDSARECVYLLDPADMPFDELGDLKSTPYNYKNIIAGKPQSDKMYIRSVNVADIDNTYFRQNFPNSKVYASFIDFELGQVRTPRTNK